MGYMVKLGPDGQKYYCAKVQEWVKFEYLQPCDTGMLRLYCGEEITYTNLEEVVTKALDAFYKDHTASCNVLKIWLGDDSSFTKVQDSNTNNTHWVYRNQYEELETKWYYQLYGKI